MSSRQNALKNWLSDCLEHSHHTLLPVAGDASFRHYFRVQTTTQSYIVMDAPPEKENIHPFIEKAQLLQAANVPVPSIFAVESQQGFMLLEDLGDTSFLQAVCAENANNLYTAAISLLHQIQTTATTTLGTFDANILQQELHLFPQWFIRAYLHIDLSAQEEALLQDTFQWLIQAIEQQPQVFVHRDYHSRNLMYRLQTSGFTLGVIDFQDALKGPFSYDLVSLLKDCYIQCSPSQLIQWRYDFYHQMPNHHGWSYDEFSQGFEVCGLQRHLKVLGIFCRLYFRDGKSQYLRDLPLTYHYVMASLEHIKELETFSHWMRQRVYPRFLEVSTACIPQ